MAVFGARLAGGCTSGHGLSGMGLLSTKSMVGVVCMFCTGIATGTALHLAKPDGSFLRPVAAGSLGSVTTLFK